MARQFQEKLGRSASDLLSDIRMALAADELKKPSMSTGAVAEAVGHQSEAAFQRAFKSHMGMTPAEWRKTQELAIQRRSVRNAPGFTEGKPMITGVAGRLLALRQHPEPAALYIYAQPRCTAYASRMA